MLFFTVIFSYSINLLRTSGWQCGILRASTQGGCSPVTPALPESAMGLQHCFSPGPCCSGRVWPRSKPIAAISLSSPTSPCPSHFRERRLFYAGPLSYPHTLACGAPQRAQEHQSKAVARRWLRDPASPTPTHPGTQGQLQVSITWRKQPASSVCITCRRRKTTESDRGQKQQPGEEEFIKKKGKGSKACLCKGRASSKPSCDLQPQRVAAGAMPTRLPPHRLSPQPGCPSERHLGTLLSPPVPSQQGQGAPAAGLRQAGHFHTPPAALFIAVFGVLGQQRPPGWASGFLEPEAPQGGTPLLLVVPRLSIPSGTQASEFPAKDLELTSKGFTVSNLSIS